MLRPVLRAMLRPAAALVFASLAACGPSPTPVTPAELPAEDQALLRCQLVGTWRLAGVGSQPQRMTAARWTLRADGRGEYEEPEASERGSGVSGATTTPLRWSLTGRNLNLRDDQSTTTFRVDDFDADAMTWFLYDSSTRYTLARAGTAEPCPEPQPDPASAPVGDESDAEGDASDVEPSPAAAAAEGDDA